MSFNSAELKLLLLIQKKESLPQNLNDLKKFYRNEGVLFSIINTDTLGNTLLHHAMLYKNYDAARLLLKCGYKIDTPNNYGLTPADISFSMLDPIYDLGLNVILKTSEKDNEKEKEKISMKKGCNKIDNKNLKTAQQSPKASPKKSTQRNLTANVSLALTPSFDMMSKLQFKTLQLKSQLEQDQTKKKTIHQFITRCELALKDERKNNWTPLMLAVLQKREDIVKLLAEYGFNDLHPKETQETALSIALRFNSISIAQYLIDNKLSDVNQLFSVPNAPKCLSILFLAFSGSFGFKTKTITLLLDSKIDLTNVPDDFFNSIQTLKNNILTHKKNNAAPVVAIDETEQNIEKFYLDAIALLRNYLKTCIIDLMAEDRIINEDMTKIRADINKTKQLLSQEMQKQKSSDAGVEKRTQENRTIHLPSKTINNKQSSPSQCSKETASTNISKNASTDSLIEKQTSLEQMLDILNKNQDELDEKLNKLRNLYEKSASPKLRSREFISTKPQPQVSNNLCTNDELWAAAYIRLAEYKDFMEFLNGFLNGAFQAPGPIGIIAEYFDEGEFSKPYMYYYGQLKERSLLSSKAMVSFQIDKKVSHEKKSMDLATLEIDPTKPMYINSTNPNHGDLKSKTEVEKQSNIPQNLWKSIASPVFTSKKRNSSPFIQIVQGPFTPPLRKSKSFSINETIHERLTHNQRTPKRNSLQR